MKYFMADNPGYVLICSDLVVYHILFTTSKENVEKFTTLNWSGENPAAACLNEIIPITTDQQNYTVELTYYLWFSIAIKSLPILFTHPDTTYLMPICELHHCKPYNIIF